MPLISVIIPTYNRSSMVVQAVESVLAQTFEDWELIVVDDGSEDNTGEVLAPYEGRLRYLVIPHSGVSAARNRGASAARGRWLAFLDSDDLWLPKKLQRQMEALEVNPGHLFCYTDEIWIRKGRRVNPGKRHRKYSGWIFERCLPLCIISPSSALIDRDLFENLGGFDEGLSLCEDYDLWLRITLRHPVLFVPEPLIIKRGGHSDQLSQSTWGLDRYRVRALWKLLKDPFLKGPYRQAVVEELQRKCGIIAGGARKRGRVEMARYYEELARISGEEIIHEVEVGNGSGLGDRLRR